MNFYYKTRHVLQEIITSSIDLGEINAIDKVAKAIFYEVNDFNDILCDLSEALELETDKIKAHKLLIKYRFVLERKKEALKYLVGGIKNETIEIIYKIDTTWETHLRELAKSEEIEETKSIVLRRIISSLEKQLYDVMEQIYLISNYPFIFDKTHKWELVSNNYEQQFLNSIVIYKNIFIDYISTSHIYILKYNEAETHGVKNDFMNTISFLVGRPIFVYTKDQNYSTKIEQIYSECDLLDLIKLRKNILFADNESKESYMPVRPIFKQTCPYRITEIPEMVHPEVLELYNAALKQAEPIPKCVFLYRVIEYAINEHYNTIIHPSNTSAPAAIEYYLNEALHHEFIPLYYIDLGRNRAHQTDAVTVFRKSQLRNLLQTLKKEVPKIKNEWSQHPFLSQKSVGEIIYSNGRCATAHGHTGTHGRYLTAFDEVLFHSIVDRIVVTEQDRLQFYLLGGFAFTEQLPQEVFGR